MTRPLAVVYQDLATPQAVTTTPDLESVLVGPAYDLLDYPDDATSILLTSAYGTSDEPAGGASVYTPPATGVDALTVNDQAYPGQSAGALVDHASVRLFMRTPKVILGATYAITDAPTFAAAATTSASDQTLVDIGAGPTTSFVTAGIQPGDRIILTSSLGTQTVVRTVASVGEPNSEGLIASGNERYLRVTQNLPASGVGTDAWTYDSSTEIRIERELATQEFVDLTSTLITFPEPGTDKLVLKGGVTLSLTLTPRPTVATPNPSGATAVRRLAYSQIYLSYRALRQDLQSLASYDKSHLQTVAGIPTVVGVGKIDARNPLAVGLQVALANAGTSPIHAYGVSSDDLVGHASALDALSSRKDLHAFVPLTLDVNILAMYRTDFVSMADPATAIADGVEQKFRAVIGAVALPTATTVYEGSISGISQQPSGADTGKYRSVSIAASSTGSVNIRSVLPGDLVTIGLTPAAAAWQNRRGTHKIGHVNTSKDYPTASDPSKFEIIPGSSRWDDAAGATSGDIECVIKAPDGSVKISNLAKVSITQNTGVIQYSMLAPTVVGGPYTIAYAVSGAIAAATVSMVGFAITVTVNGTSHTTANVAAAINASPLTSALVSASVTANGSSIVNGAIAATDIVPVVGSCTSTVVINDTMFNRLEDSSASFLTAGVKAGDVIEIPLDPNDYASDAYDGRVLSYTVAVVLNENRLLISNGVDDTDTEAKELPHYFARDLQDRYVDITAPNAMNYRVRRLLSKDEQVLALAAISASINHKRGVIAWPDQVYVTDLRDGSLPRSVSTERAAAGTVPGWAVACQIAGAAAGLPAQHGLTNLGLSGIRELTHSTGYFTERQLSRLSDSGFFVMVQDTPSSLPYSIHQLTTNPSTVEDGEFSVMRNVDFISKSMLEVVRPFIGPYNVTDETINNIRRAVASKSENLRGLSVDKIGPPLLTGTVADVRASEVDGSKVEVFFEGTVPLPLNSIAFHLVL